MNGTSFDHEASPAEGSSLSGERVEAVSVADVEQGGPCSVGVDQGYILRIDTGRKVWKVRWRGRCLAAKPRMVSWLRSKARLVASNTALFIKDGERSAGLFALAGRGRAFIRSRGRSW